MTTSTITDLRNWEAWIVHSTTEDQLATVIRRHHREQYAHDGTCPFSECEVHATPLTELPALGSDMNK